MLQYLGVHTSVFKDLCVKQQVRSGTLLEFEIDGGWELFQFMCSMPKVWNIEKEGKTPKRTISRWCLCI